jgi:hypothetical protein
MPPRYRPFLSHVAEVETAGVRERERYRSTDDRIDPDPPDVGRSDSLEELWEDGVQAEGMHSTIGAVEKVAPGEIRHQTVVRASPLAAMTVVKLAR